MRALRTGVSDQSLQANEGRCRAQQAGFGYATKLQTPESSSGGSSKIVLSKFFERHQRPDNLIFNYAALVTRY